MSNEISNTDQLPTMSVNKRLIPCIGFLVPDLKDVREGDGAYSSVGSKPLCFPSKEDSKAGRADFRVIKGVEGAILARGRELVRHEYRGRGERCTCLKIDKGRPVRNDFVTLEGDVRDCVGEWDSVLS